jgi:hypothetical protein
MLPIFRGENNPSSDSNSRGWWAEKNRRMGDFRLCDLCALRG